VGGSKICLYGTVYNNADYIERSILSVYSPEYDIIIVDNFSTDGTWEKLLKLKKEFNLRLYRYKCSRGLGRDIALRKCPENSLTAYFDLDTEYFHAYHKVIRTAEIYGSASAPGLVVVSKEHAVRRGGWRDLNMGEDTDFAVRMSPAIHIPVILGRNALPSTMLHVREKRYSNKLKTYYKRFVKNHLDYSRGIGLNAYHLIKLKSKRLALLSPLIFFYLKFYKPYRYYDNFLNVTIENLLRVTRLLPPREAGINENLFFLNLDKGLCKVVNFCERIDKFVIAAVSPPLIKLKFDSFIHWRIYAKDVHLILSQLSFLRKALNGIELLRE